MSKSKKNKLHDSITAEVVLPAVPEPIGLKSTDSLVEGAHKLLKYYFTIMINHELGTRMGVDPEELHDMRVCSRRLRAVFDVFGAGFDAKAIRKQQKGLRLTGRALGNVRDWDVFMLKAHEDIALLPQTDQIMLQPLLQDWQTQHQLARQKLIDFLDCNQFIQFKTEFGLFAQDPTAGALKPSTSYFEGHLLPNNTILRDLAPCLLYTRLANIRAFESVIPTSVEEVGQAKMAYLHAFRIEVKRLHYSLDFLKEILGQEGRILLKVVKSLQDHLGDLHDADVACLSLEKIPSTPAIQTYIELKRQQRNSLLAGFPSAWQIFNTAENRALLSRSILSL